MDRKEFLNNMGLAAFAVCTGSCFAACSKSSSSPGGGGGGGSVNFTIDLSTQLLDVGDSTAKSGVVVARLSAGSDPSNFTAVAQACTHQGTPVAYNSSSNLFVCPLHGSEFSTSGGVVQGPATSPLKKYSISISGNTMTVTG